jgi:Predicted ferric reductase
MNPANSRYLFFKRTAGLAALLFIGLIVDYGQRNGLVPGSVQSWMVVRVLGMTAFLLLFLGICIGIVLGMPVWKGKKASRNLWISIHFYLNTGCIFLAALHPMLLIADTVPFTWLQILLPFTAPHEPFLYGLGTVTLYGFLFLLITADLRKRIPVRVWHSLHLLSYLLFLTALAHGTLGGTDNRNPLIFLMYAVTFSIVLILMITQVRMAGALKKKAAQKQLIS